MERYVTPKRLGEMAREARERAGLSQRDAAQQLGRTQPEISFAENANPGRPGTLELAEEMVERFAGYKVEGPFYRVEPPEIAEKREADAP